MQATIEIPDPPEGCEKPEYRALYLPIDPRAYILRGLCWWRAESVLNTGGELFITCIKPNTPVDQREVSAPTGGSEEEAQ